MYQTGNTIEETLNQVHKHYLVLAATRKEVVWRREQICQLYDRPMQGCLYETFRNRQVAPETGKKFNSYGFVPDYHERDSRQSPPLPPMPTSALTAVLDGQQHGPARNVGLCGSVARKLTRHRWDAPETFPKRRPYTDLLWNAGEDEEEVTGHRLSSRPENEPSQRMDPAGYRSECWFRVSEVLSMDSGPTVLCWLDKRRDQPFLGHVFETPDRLLSVDQKDHLVTEHSRSGQSSLTGRVLN